jgi:hypothetical protein
MPGPGGLFCSITGQAHGQVLLAFYALLIWIWHSIRSEFCRNRPRRSLPTRGARSPQAAAVSASPTRAPFAHLTAFLL